MSRESANLLFSFVRDNRSTFAYQIPEEDAQGEEISPWAVSEHDYTAWPKVVLDEIDLHHIEEADMQDDGLMFKTGTTAYFVSSASTASGPSLESAEVPGA